MLKRGSRHSGPLIVSLGVSLGVSLVALLSASCQSRRFNSSGGKSVGLVLSPDSFHGVLLRSKPMPIWEAYEFANAALEWQLSQPFFRNFIVSEWTAKPYGSYRFDYLIQPRGELTSAYKGSDFESDIRALTVALEKNFIAAPGDEKVEAGPVERGKASVKVEILLKDGLDHGEKNFELNVPLPWDSSRRVGTNDPDWARTFVRVPDAWVHLATLNKQPGEGVTIGVIDTGILPHPVVWGAGEKLPPQFDMSKAANFESTGKSWIENAQSHFTEPRKIQPESWTRRPALSSEDVKAVDVFSFNAAPANPGHGTAVVSLLSGVGKGTFVESDNPNAYVQGMVPAATIIPVRVGSSIVALNPEPMAEAFEHLTKNGANVITVSLGGVPGVRLHEALIQAYKKGIIVTAAAGNSFPFVAWPAAYKEAIAVGAGDIHCKVWSGSAPGTKVEIIAPGDDVWYAASFFDKRLYERKGDVPASDALIYTVKRSQGTSFATPHVAAAAALWLSKYGLENIKNHYQKDKLGKHSDHRYVSLAFRYIMAQEGGHTACPAEQGKNEGRDGGGKYLNMLSLLARQLSSFPSKAQLDKFEVGGLREQQSYDLAVAALATLVTGVPEVLAGKKSNVDHVGLLPEGVRNQLINIFKQKLLGAKGASN